jgi:predicted glycoside hydrolase/deacetylase ChbG (UPF0249 family)
VNAVTAPRRLIVNADDFGHSLEVNAGILEAHYRGIVTSASLMVWRPGTRAAARYAGGSLDVGLHLELGEWEYLRGAWREIRRGPDEATLESEIRLQLEVFRDLTGQDPTHLDTHQHAHREEPARSILLALGDELDVPVRELRGGIRYAGGFYGADDLGKPWLEGVTVETLVRLLRELEPGTTELGCHPGRGFVTGTSYAQQRPLEVETLCDRRVVAAVAELGIELAGFAGAMV